VDASALASTTHLAQAVNAEASSLWSRAVGVITGQQQENDYGERIENGRVIADGPGEEKRDTASARFAHYSVEVYLYPITTKTQSDFLVRIPLRTSEPLLRMAFCTRTLGVYGTCMVTTSSLFRRPNLCYSNLQKLSMRVH